MRILYKEKEIFIINTNIFGSDNYNQYKILMFLAQKIDFFSIFCGKYYDKVSAFLLTLA